jgi:hypothetical protein
MPIETSDVRSNPDEQIRHGAKVLKKSEDRKKVFDAIHTRKKRYKTILELEHMTGLKRKRVLEETVKLFNNKLIPRKKIGGELACGKDNFLAQNKNLILRLAGNKRKLESFATKSNPKIAAEVFVRLPSSATDAVQLTIDDLDSFSKVRGHYHGGRSIAVNEKAFKEGIKKILGEDGTFQDWGGESDDLFSTRVVIKGVRKIAAFGLKGKGTKGILYPKMMGKRGDQIQKLFRAPATIFLVQYWDQIDESILEQMKGFAVAKSALEGNRVYYGVIDGKDTARIMSAYHEAFAEIGNTTPMEAKANGKKTI